MASDGDSGLPASGFRPPAAEGGDPPCAAGCSRRDVINATAAVACAPILVSMGCARRIDPARAINIPAPVEGKLVVSRALAPELDRIGGAVVLHPAGGAEAVLLANAGDGFLAMHARCPHAGCELTWVHEDKMAECPCHGSRFASDGTVLYPPADLDVAVFAVEVDRTTLDVIVRLEAGDETFPAVKDGKLVFTLDDRPELQSVGGSATGKPVGLGRPLTVVRFSATEVRAYDATCTHQQCTVRHRPSERIFVCPCHGSRFDEDGQVTRDPAKGPLGRYAAALAGRTVTVTVA